MDYIKSNSLFEILEVFKEDFKQFELDSEGVVIEHALGRFVAEDIRVRDELPGFDKAAVDGFAVISGDTYGTGDGQRAVFTQIGQSEVGKECSITLGTSECLYVSAGAMMPLNGDAVISIEDTEVIGPLEVAINSMVNRGENVIRKGNDLKKHDILLHKGTRVGAREVGALAGAGFSHVKVFKKIHIAVISTGEEIVEPFNTILLPGKVRDINSHMICAELRNIGVITTNKGIVKDNSREMEESLKKSLETCDIILISGGSSEGTMDKTLSVIKRIDGVELITSKIGINPGKDTIIAKLGNKIVYGLPGNPVSALITVNLLVKPLVLQLNKAKNKQLTIKARCMIDYSSTLGREEYLMVKLDNNEDGYIAIPLTSKIGLVTSMLKSDGYIKIRASDDGVKRGQEVGVVLF